MFFNGFDFTEDLIVEEVLRTVMPTVINSSKSVSGFDGSIFSNSQLGENYITVKCRIIKNTRLEVQDSIRQIAGKLYSEKPEKLILKDQPGKYNIAIVEGMTDIEKYMNTGYFEILFVCHNPFTFGELNNQILNEEFKNNGTVATDVIIKMTAGTSESIVVNIGKSSEKLEIIYPFNGTQIVVIDTERQHISINGNNAMRYLSFESDFFKIPPGSCKVNANANGTVSFIERYL